MTDGPDGHLSKYTQFSNTHRSTADCGSARKELSDNQFLYYLVSSIETDYRFYKQYLKENLLNYNSIC